MCPTERGESIFCPISNNPLNYKVLRGAIQCTLVFPLIGGRGCIIRYLCIGQSEVQFCTNTFSVGGTARDSGSLMVTNSFEMFSLTS